MSRTINQQSRELERIRRFYNRQAPSYDRGIRFMERVALGEWRASLCSMAVGDVLEIGAGTGLNFAHYPPTIRLTAIELSPAMLALAQARAADLGLNANLRLGDAQALQFDDGQFDTVTCTLALCTIPNDRRALSEAYRVLRPGGQLLLLEHVRSPNPVVRTLEYLLDPLAVRSMGDHLVRDPVDHLAGTGFVVEHVERAKLGLLERVVARRPGSGQAIDSTG